MNSKVTQLYTPLQRRRPKTKKKTKKKQKKMTNKKRKEQDAKRPLKVAL